MSAVLELGGDVVRWEKFQAAGFNVTDCTRLAGRKGGSLSLGAFLKMLDFEGLAGFLSEAPEARKSVRALVMDMNSSASLDKLNHFLSDPESKKMLLEPTHFIAFCGYLGGQKTKKELEKYQFQRVKLEESAGRINR